MHALRIFDMSVPNAGIAAAADSAEAQDATNLKAEVSSGEERRVAPDQFDPKYETSKWEVWSYYGYYVGNNGLSLFNYAPTGKSHQLALIMLIEVQHFRTTSMKLLVILASSISLVEIAILLQLSSFRTVSVSQSKLYSFYCWELWQIMEAGGNSF